MPVPILVICGATATGKSALAAAVAQHLGSEVVNADSMQVYRGLDIGTGKPGAALLARAPHHGIGHVALTDQYSAAAFKVDMDPVLDRLLARGVSPVVCGGSGLYLRALIEGLFPGPPRDAELRMELQARAALLGVPALHAELTAVDAAAAERIAENDEHRVIRALEVYRLTGIPISEHHAARTQGTARANTRWFGVACEREDVRARIAARTRAIFAAGLVDEVRALCAAGAEPDLRRLRPLGYTEIVDALAQGTADARREAEALTIVHTQQFAKRQGTWFRNQHAMEWLQLAPGESAERWGDRVAAAARAPHGATPSPGPR